ncbi:MAG: hypothetical protein HYV09_34330 [Deltaproteobacteria bacterium]|nr:hypothetical protein [Deltaproteobacteria bacterium]
MRRLLPLASFALVVLVACGSSEDKAATQPDASVDAGDAGREVWVSDGKPVYPEIKCGPGPYVDWALQPIGQTIGEIADVEPAERIKVSLSACPEVKGETDAEGYATLKLTVGQPVSIRLDSDNWLPTRWHEITPQKWSQAPTLTIMAKDAAKELPGFAADKGVILVDVTAAEAGTCFDNEGVAVTVKDHPEAVISYHAASAPFAPVAAATGTTSSGLVSIQGIAPGTKVVIEGIKTGCSVSPFASPGGVLVEAGVVSRTQLLVHETLPTCGPPPWFMLSGLSTTRETSGAAGTPIADVEVSFTTCPGVKAKTDAAGAWKAWVGQNMPVARRYQKDGFFVTHSPEQFWPQDYDKVDLSLRNVTTWTSLMPRLDTTHGYVLVGIAAPKTGDCVGVEGVTLTVNGHPDAKVMYMDGEPPKEVAGTATTKRGLAYISGLKPGDLVDGTITGAREGCVYSLKGGIDTGNAKLEAGALTIVSVYASKAP